MLIFLLMLAIGGEPEKAAIELRTGGGLPGDARFGVTLTAAGRMDVWKESLPIVRHCLTRHSRTFRLDATAVARLVDLASDAGDFAQGCDTAADGTSAVLLVRRSGQERRYECHDARAWPIGPRIKRFMNELNSHLPEDWRVF